MKKNIYLVLAFIALIFLIARFFMPTHPLSPHGTYEAFAHLFVGGLFGAWMVSKLKIYLILALIMSAGELAAFLILR
jgi:hypothetical protein